MDPPYPCLTSTWHNDTYDAISPSRPELSAVGKTVVVTGAGSGIGRETARAFASAGASTIVLVGRHEDTLQETGTMLANTNTVERVCVADVTEKDSMHQLAQSIQTWDILIMSAGTSANPSSVAEASVDDWWGAFEVNTKGALLTVQNLLPKAATDAIILGVTTAAILMPPAMLPGLSAYSASKLAVVKMLEAVAAENPNIFVASVHPGAIDTAMYTKNGRPPIPLDTVQLPAHFMTWMSSPEARFLRGRTVWANWDVEELQAKATEIESGNLLTSGVYGFPF